MVQGCRGQEKKSRGGKGRITDAFDIYELLVGEIGIPRRDFLYDLDYWEVQRIIDGYRRREHSLWQIARWQTFCLMHNGILDLSKANVKTPDDLIKFEWEKEQQEGEDLDSDEIDDLRSLLKDINK